MFTRESHDYFNVQQTFTQTSGSILFIDGQNEHHVNISTKNDDVAEPDTSFVFKLIQAFNVQAGIPLREQPIVDGEKSLTTVKGKFIIYCDHSQGTYCRYLHLVYILRLSVKLE